MFIEARDLGKPQLVGRTRLVIYVSDVNDNSPIITVSFIYHSKDNTGNKKENTENEILLVRFNTVQVKQIGSHRCGLRQGTHMCKILSVSSQWQLVLIGRLGCRPVFYA